MGKETKKISLRVAEAKAQDVGRGICRIDPEIAEELGIRTGDIVRITGTKSTAVLAWLGYADDRGRKIIRIDGATRYNAGIGIDDKVTIEKIDGKHADRVVLAPADQYTIANGAHYLKSVLEGRVLSKGDIIEIPVLNRKIRFGVKEIYPNVEAVIVSLRTEVELVQEPFDETRHGKKEIAGDIPQISYEDIGGLNHAIQKVREMIELPMKHPELFEKLGIEPPKGVLLYGPPGTGKTLLARAVANESQASFYSISGPEIMSKFYGESEERLRQVFEEASKTAPSIIFIDELDSIAPKREEVSGEVERRIVAQLLTLMDGLQSRGQVIVIGATNRPNAVDPALRRPGRFDREIEIGVPNTEGRREIFEVHARGMPLADDVDLDELAKKTHGFVGADIEALCKEAAMRALRRILPEINLDEEEIPAEVLERLVVTKDDFDTVRQEMEPSAMREVLVDIPNVGWDDIGGLEKVKLELQEAIQWPLKYPGFYKHMGANPPKGILLHGPPGTGKTLLAKAVAKESEANFIAVKGPEFLSKWVGESEKAVRETFRKARQAAPCVIFVDEIDAIATARGSRFGDSGVTERVVSQILTEMDGLEELKGVTVIAATNRPDLIDQALLRPGRFDRIIEVPIPDERSRKEILKIHARGKPFDDKVNWERIVKETDGFSGAELAAIISEATMAAIRDYITEGKIAEREQEEWKAYKITQKHLDMALDKIKRTRHHSRTDKTASFIS